MVVKLQNRVGFEELKEKCNEALELSTDKKLKEAFKKKIESFDKGDGADLIELEKAYNEFAAHLPKPSIKDVYVNGVQCEIDVSRKQIIINADSDISANDIIIEPALNTVVTSRIYDLKPGGSQKLSICSKDSKIYDEWKFISKVNESKLLCAGRITTDSISNDKIRKAADGGTSFLPFGNYYAYYLNGKTDHESDTSVTFSVRNSVENNRVSFILGANALEGFVPGDSNAKYDRIDVEFYNQLLNIYYVKSGVRTLAKSFVSNLKYNSENVLKYRLENTGKNTFVKLILNDAEYSTAIAAKVCGDRFGFYSSKNTVIIY